MSFHQITKKLSNILKKTSKTQFENAKTQFENIKTKKTAQVVWWKSLDRRTKISPAMNSNSVGKDFSHAIRTPAHQDEFNI